MIADLGTLGERMKAEVRLKAWSNGRKGLGLEVEEPDWRQVFRPRRQQLRRARVVTVEFPPEDAHPPTTANIDKGSFWDGCHELIKKEIGLWLKGRGEAPPWNGRPPRYAAEFEHSNGIVRLRVLGRVD